MKNFKTTKKNQKIMKMINRIRWQNNFKGIEARREIAATIVKPKIKISEKV